MNYNTIFISLVLIFMAACNPVDVPMENVENVEEVSAPMTLDLLSKNEKIKIGPIQKKSMARQINCTGKIEIPPTEISSVHAKINGQILFLKYLPGDYVKKGTLLATIENPMLIEKQRMLLETKANLEFARKDFERKKILKTGQATPEKTFEASQNKFNLLTATYLGLKKELQLFGVNTNTLESDATFQSSVNIYANQSGYVQEVLVNKGQMVTPETPLMNTANTNHLHVELQVLAKDIGAVYVDQEVNFSIPGRSEIFKAKVVKINPVIGSGKSTLQAHCHIEHPDKKIFVAGSFVNATINTEAAEQAGLSLNAVIKEGEDYFGYKIENNEAQRVLLRQAEVTNDFVVFEGEKTGQWIIEGAYYVE